MEANGLNFDLLNLLNVADAMADVSVRCSDAEKQKIREEKLYLKLLTTIGSVEFNQWLPQAKTDGHYYFIDHFKIAKRKESRKESVNLREVPGVINAVKMISELAGQPDIARRAAENAEGVNVEDAQMLFPALALALKGLTNVMSKQYVAPGDIFQSDFSWVEETKTDLIDLYMIQEHLAERSQAIEKLCAMFNIPEDISTPVEIPRDRSWIYRRLIDAPIYPDSDTTKQYIDFYENKLLLGRIVCQDKKIIGPLTYWSKNPETLPKGLTIPFPAPYPLWNMNQIRKNPEASVLLLSSPLAADSIDKLSDRMVNDKKRQIEEIESRKEFRHNCLRNVDFFNKVHAHVDQRLSELVSQDYPRVKEEMEAFKVRLFNAALNMFYASANFPEPPTQEDEEYSQNAYRKCSVITAKDSHELTQRILMTQIDRRISLSPKQLYWFCECYKAIKEYVVQTLEKDRKEIDELEQEIEELDKRISQLVICSWYGGLDTVSDVAWEILSGRTVWFYLQTKSRDQIELALNLEKYLTKQRASLHFLTFKDNQYIEIAYEDLHKFADELSIKLMPETERKKLVSPELKQLQCFNFDELPPQRTDRKYVIFPIIEDHTITMLYSPEGLGKTLVAMSIGLAASSGTKVFGEVLSNTWEAPKPVPVLYIDGEMSSENFIDRLCRFSSFYKNQFSELKQSVNFYYRLLAGKNWDLSSNESQREQITKMVQAHKIQLLILDNLSTLANFSETTKAWQSIFTWMKDLATHNCAILLIHHADKSGDQQRGSGAKTITVDNVIKLQHALGGGARRGVAINVQIEKGRSIPPEYKEPFNIMLKTEKNADGLQTFKWVRTTSKTQGKEITIQERNAALYQASKSKVFNQQILADYFGLDVRQVKAILARQEDLELQRVEKTAQQIITQLKISDTPTKQKQNRIARIITKVLSGQTKENDSQSAEDGDQEQQEE